MTKNELIITDILGQLDKRNSAFYASLSEEHKKQISPLVLMRWLSSVADEAVDFNEAKRQGRKKGDGKGKWPSVVKDNALTEYYIRITNEVVNVGLFGLSKHPELLWKLLSVVGVGRPQNHMWIKNSSKDKPFSKITDLLQKKFPMAGYKEIDLLKTVMTVKEFEQIISDMGFQYDEIKELLSEFKAMKKEQNAKEKENT